MNKEEIIEGIRYIKPVKHRLELLPKPNGSIVIDDAYNSNSTGAEMALEVLKSFETRKKILITPGIVDLGEHSEEYNKKLGKQAAEAADFVILVGEKQAQPIYKGLQEKNFSDEKIYVAKDLKDALAKMEQIADANSVILFENDLPDNYM